MAVRDSGKLGTNHPDNLFLYFYGIEPEKLPEDMRQEITLHLDSCSRCVNIVKEYKAKIETFKKQKIKLDDETGENNARQT